MRCPKCGTEIPTDARYCSFCANKLELTREPLPSFPERHESSWTIRFALVALLALLLLAALYLSMDAGYNPFDGEPNSGGLIVTLANPYMIPGLQCNYTLYVNGELESTGIIPSGSSYVFQKNYTWSGSELELVIHVEVQGSDTQPEDKMVTLTPGNVERIAIMLYPL